MKRNSRLICAGMLMIFLAGCAAGSADARVAASGGDLPQFFLGLWHGIIAPITLIVEIINRLAPSLIPWRAHMYETGAGVAYDVGFYLGLGGGPSFVVHRWRYSRA